MLTTRDVTAFLKENNVKKGVFAKAMDMHPTYLGAILNGKTAFTEKSQEKVREAMKSFAEKKSIATEAGLTPPKTTKKRRTRRANATKEDKSIVNRHYAGEKNESIFDSIMREILASNLSHGTKAFLVTMDKR